MSEPAPETTSPNESETMPAQPKKTEEQAEETKDWQAEAAKWQEMARKHEARAKANAEAAKRIEAVEREKMSEVEKAVADARTSERAAVAAEYAGRFARQAFIAEAKARALPGAEALAARLDLSDIVTAEGEVDGRALAKLLEEIAPSQSDTAQAGRVDLAQGMRSRGNGAVALNDDDRLLGDLKRHLGVR